jgi:hypothetical protein
MRNSILFVPLARIQQTFSGIDAIYYYKYSFPFHPSPIAVTKSQTFVASVDGTNGETTPVESHRPITYLKHS